MSTLSAPEERLARLVTQLDSDARYATGSRRFPGHVTRDDAVAIAGALADEFDEGVQARAALAAKQGHQIACDIGCHRCCTVVVMAFAPEALRVARFLQQPENSVERDQFLAQYPTWRATLGDEVERLPTSFKSERPAEYDALHMRLWRKGALCAFNHAGVCSIYPVRPIACRNAHALDTDARCVPDPPDGKPAAAVDFVPLRQFLDRATRLLRATHNATPGHTSASQRHHNDALCSAVYRLLTT